MKGIPGLEHYSTSFKSYVIELLETKM